METLDNGSKVKITNKFREHDGKVGEVDGVKVDVSYYIRLDDGTVVDCHAEEVEKIE